MIMVDGRQMRVRTSGLSSAERGRPTIVLEAGGGQNLETWDPIFARVAALGPVVAYDRRGEGKSPADTIAQTPERIVHTLHALLASAGARPPYVLVGHSWGGPLIRMFAGLFPNEVAGLLYVDPTDLRTAEEDLAVFKEQGYSEDYVRVNRGDPRESAALLDSLEKFPTMSVKRRCLGEKDDAPPVCDAVLMGVLGSYFANYRKLAPVSGDVPISVLMSAMPVPDDAPAPWNSGPCKGRMRGCSEIQIRHRIGFLWRYAKDSRHGALIATNRSGHFVHHDEPELVLSQLERILGSARKGM